MTNGLPGYTEKLETAVLPYVGDQQFFASVTRSSGRPGDTWNVAGSWITLFLWTGRPRVAVEFVAPDIPVYAVGFAASSELPEEVVPRCPSFPECGRTLPDGQSTDGGGGFQTLWVDYGGKPTMSQCFSICQAPVSHPPRRYRPDPDADLEEGEEAGGHIVLAGGS